MDYRNYAIDLLKRKTQLEAAYESLGYELEMLENEKYSVSSATISPAPVSGTGGNRYENKLVNLIVLIDDARFRRKIVERELKMIEMGFSVLDDYKRDLLEMHYVNSIPSPTVAAMEKYYKERSQIFEDKKKALEAFTRAVYGVVVCMEALQAVRRQNARRRGHGFETPVLHVRRDKGRGTGCARCGRVCRRGGWGRFGCGVLC